MSSTDDARLDNPVHAALTGAQARFAQVCGHARRYPVDVAPFLALPSQPSREDWRDAADLVPPGAYAAVVHTGTDVPETWKTLQEFEVVQMIGELVNGTKEPEAISLNAADVPEMLELARQTDPGPFLERTIELGDYLGIRRDSRLVAMAGERLHFDGWTEISAVCTAPTHRGHGMASRLVGALIAGIQHRSERAFLHVLPTNTSAIHLYETLGFRARRRLTISVLTPQAVPSQETQPNQTRQSAFTARPPQASVPPIPGGSARRRERPH
jgi:predicted GNAT family acetyltransferase